MASGLLCRCAHRRRRTACAACRSFAEAAGLTVLRSLQQISTQSGLQNMSNSTHKRRLLIVASAPEGRRLRAILKTVEAEIVCTSSVDQGRELLESSGAFDAVIVDDALPRGGWRELMELGREERLRAPFLVCTSEVGGKSLLAESKKTFVPDVLVRPYRKELVRRRVSAALETGRSRPLAGATLPSHPLE